MFDVDVVIGICYSFLLIVLFNTDFVSIHSEGNHNVF